MPFSLADLVYGAVCPAMTAAALSIVLSCRQRADAVDSLRRMAVAIPFLTGFHVGYWLLSLGKPVPESHWEWLPWALLLTGIGILPTSARTSLWLLRIVAVLLAVIASSWVLVPAWEHLEPSRELHLLTLVMAVVVVATLMEPLSMRFPACWFLLLLAAILTAGSVILALAGSLRFAQMAGCGVAALMGMAITAFFDRSRRPAAGIALPFCLLIAAMMLIGRVNSFSDVPLVSYLLPPLAPLTLWPALRGPLADATGLRHWLVLSLPLVVCLTAVLLAADI